MNALTLYDAEERLLMLVDSEAMLTDDAESQLLAECAAELGQATQDALEKRDSVARFILSIRAAIEAKKAEASRLMEDARAAESKLKRLQEYVLDVVKRFGVIPKGAKSPKLVGHTFQFMAKVNSVAALRITTHATEKELPDLAAITITIPLPFADVLERRLAELATSNPLAVAVTANQAQLKEAIANGKIGWNTDHIRTRLAAGEKIDGFELHRGSHLEVK